MLLPVQSFLLQRVELGIRSNLQRLARLVGLSQSADGGIVLGLGDQSRCDWSHLGQTDSKRYC